MASMVRWLKRWLPVFIWMGVIWYFSSRTAIKAAEFDPIDFVIKKTAHLTEYAVLFLLILRAIGGRQREKTLVLGLIYAFVDETHQLFSPGRGAKLLDVLLFDLGGLTIGWWVSNKLWRKR